METAPVRVPQGRRAGTGDVERLAPQEQELWSALGRVVLRLPRVLDVAMVRATGLTMTEFAVLEVLRKAPARTARLSDVAERTGLSGSRVSRVVAALEGGGRCRRQRDDADGRSSLITLTEAGLGEVTAAARHHTELARRHVLDHVPPEALRSLVDVLSAVADGPRST